MAENEKILNDAQLGKVAGGTGEAYMESHVYFGDTLESIASWYWVSKCPHLRQLFAACLSDVI